MNILIAAGGSGGHLLPAQQLAQALSKNAHIFFAGHGLTSSPFFQRALFSYQEIPSAPLKITPKGLLSFAGMLCKGFQESLRLLRTLKPDVVVGFGSFHSVPLLLASVLSRKPIVLFEANCVLGKVNRLFSPFAQKVAMQFALPSQKSHYELVPLLPWISSEKIEKTQARKTLDLSPNQPTFLIFGGSQGADFLNHMIPQIIPDQTQAIHITGKEESVSEVKKAYEQANRRAIVYSFSSNMELLYAASDCAICRSGASTIAELIRYELPALLIPFPFSSNDHQSANAAFLAKKVEGATMLSQENADPKTLALKIETLLKELPHWKERLAHFRIQCEGRSSLAKLIMGLGEKT